jgi:hypothetical protein
MNVKAGPLTMGKIHTHGNSKRLFEGMTTNNYKPIVYEEFQHLF